MRAAEIDNHDICLHTFRERADLLVDSQRASPIERRCKQRLLRGDWCIFLTIRKVYYSVTGPRVPANARAPAPIKSRDQRRKTGFFENVTGVIARDGIASQANGDSLRDELSEGRAAMAQLRVGLRTMSDSSAALLDELEIGLIDVDTVRQ